MWPARGGRRRRLRRCSVRWRTGVRCGSCARPAPPLFGPVSRPRAHVPAARRRRGSRAGGGALSGYRPPRRSATSCGPERPAALCALPPGRVGGRRPISCVPPPRAAPAPHRWIKGWRLRSVRGGRSSCSSPRRSRPAPWSVCGSRSLLRPDADGAGRRSSDRPAVAARRQSARESPSPTGAHLPEPRRHLRNRRSRDARASGGKRPTCRDGDAGGRRPARGGGRAPHRGRPRHVAGSGTLRLERRNRRPAARCSGGGSRSRSQPARR